MAQLRIDVSEECSANASLVRDLYGRPKVDELLSGMIEDGLKMLLREAFRKKRGSGKLAAGRLP
jgi:hypothetical protein